jgi:hypothetical protein
VITVTVLAKGGRYDDGVAHKLWFLRRLHLFGAMIAEDVEAASHESRSWRCDGGQSALNRASDRLCLLKEAGSVRATDAEDLEDSWICEARTQDFLSMLARHPLVMTKGLIGRALQIFKLEDTLASVAYRTISGSQGVSCCCAGGLSPRLPSRTG